MARSGVDARCSVWHGVHGDGDSGCGERAAIGSSLGRQMPTKRQQLKFSSARFGRTVSKLCRIYGLLTLAALLQHTFGGDWCDLLKWSAAIVCFWQGCSIIENEASANASPWAKIAGKILVDKTSRHLGIEPEDLAEIIKIDDEIKTKNPKNQENNC